MLHTAGIFTEILQKGGFVLEIHFSRDIHQAPRQLSNINQLTSAE